MKNFTIALLTFFLIAMFVFSTREMERVKDSANAAIREVQVDAERRVALAQREAKRSRLAASHQVRIIANLTWKWNEAIHELRWLMKHTGKSPLRTLQLFWVLDPEQLRSDRKVEVNKTEPVDGDVNVSKTGPRKVAAN